MDTLLIEPWVQGRHWGRWGEGEMKAGDYILLEASGCCEDPVTGKMVQVGLLLLDEEGSFEAALSWG